MILGAFDAALNKYTTTPMPTKTSQKVAGLRFQIGSNRAGRTSAMAGVARTSSRGFSGADRATEAEWEVAQIVFRWARVPWVSGSTETSAFKPAKPCGASALPAVFDGAAIK